MSEQTQSSPLLVALTAVLAVVCLYQAYRLSVVSSEINAGDLSPVLLEECLNSTVNNLASNQIDPAAIAPRLLDDTREIAEYVEAFPIDDYKVYPMQGGW